MLFCLRLKYNHSLEDSWNILENENLSILYGTDEKNHFLFYVETESLEQIPPLDCLIDSQPYELPPIDWEAQWSSHGRNYHDGFVHLSLKDQVIRLKPGPGFGDFSHPTTQMTLEFLTMYLHEKSLIDVGCGSGILSLAAAVLGAHQVIGIDIDQQALIHSQENSYLNGLEKQCKFILPEEFKNISGMLAIAMNMISSEQEIAWQSLPALHHYPSKLFISGIRKEERNSYLTWTKKQGWILVEENEKEGWLAFYFKI